jgi:hypothetical protein
VAQERKKEKKKERKKGIVCSCQCLQKYEEERMDEGMQERGGERKMVQQRDTRNGTKAYVPMYFFCMLDLPS